MGYIDSTDMLLEVTRFQRRLLKRWERWGSHGFQKNWPTEARELFNYLENWRVSLAR
jgi:hypothetical protein